MISSYPIIKTNIQHYDVIWPSIIWRYDVTMASSKEEFLFTMQVFTLSPVKVQINNKTIIKFGSHRIWRIIEASRLIVLSASALLDLVQKLFIIFSIDWALDEEIFFTWKVNTRYSVNSVNPLRKFDKFNIFHHRVIIGFVKIVIIQQN